MANDMQAEYFTTEEVMGILNVSRSTVRRLCSANKIPYIKIGDSVRINKKGFYEWLSNNMNQRVIVQPPTGKNSQKEDED